MDMNIPREIHEIAPDVFWVGVKDWDRRMFDRLIPLPQGTTYNAFLIKGNKKIAVVDSVNPGFEDQYLEKLRSLVNLKDINYIVMNHAEPDHANAIKILLEKTKA